MNISNFIQELKRRNVFKVAAAYAIAGWLIIQIATSVFPAFEFPTWTTQFVIILVAIGLPLSLIFAWAFELTPDGIKKSKEVDITESVTNRTGKKLNGLIIGVLSVALFFVVIERVFFATSGMVEADQIDITNASIAVLPFVNMSGDVNNEYFSDGLSEELLNGLAKLNDLQVAGRTSSFQFKGSNPDLRDVGIQLGVKHILEGSVRKDGENIRITAQLIQADNGFHLWSETYDRELTTNGIFSIQEEITRKVVDELKVRLLPGEAEDLVDRPTQDIEAYNAYLEGTQLEVDRTADVIEAAIKKYKEAVRIDPTFATAYSRLAYAYSLLFTYGDISEDEAKYLVRKNAEQAILLDEAQGKAYQAMAYYYYDFELDNEKAAQVAQNAVKYLPNDPFSYNTLYVIYRAIGEWDKAGQNITKAYELDPLSPTIADNFTWELYLNEKYEKAYTLNQKILERNPDFMRSIGTGSSILSAPPYGKIDEAFILLYDTYKKNPTDFYILNQLYSISRSLDMLQLQDYFQSKLKLEYPSNRQVNINEIDSHIDRKEYTEAESMLNAVIEEYGNTAYDYVGLNLVDIYFAQGRIDKAISVFEKSKPELVNENPVIDERLGGLALRYAWLLDLNGDKERASKIRSIALSTLQIQKRKQEEKGLKYAVLNLEIQIALNSKEFDTFFDLYEQNYFVNKNKRNALVGLQQNTYYHEVLDGYEKHQDIKMRIYEDIHSLRANVVDYLKAEGEWKEEWEVGNSK